MYKTVEILIAYILDLIFGDPYCFPHPVKYIGKLISYFEKKVRKFANKEKIKLNIGGLILWIMVVFITYTLTYLIILASKKVDLFFGFKFKIFEVIISSILLYTTLSAKCLAIEAKKIYEKLKEGNIVKTRKQLSYIVGRDTTELDENEIIRATVETVAENTVDGIVSPLFFAIIGGAPLAMAYKAVNTMDSMLGYKNEKYKHIGLFPAKIDDLFNYIPARISLIFFTIGAFFLKYNWKNCFYIGLRDRKNHKSPNCAYPEGAVAGALNIQLGGTNTYFGEVFYKPTIGDLKKQLKSKNIIDCIKLMYAVDFIFIVFITILSFGKVLI